MVCEILWEKMCFRSKTYQLISLVPVCFRSTFVIFRRIRPIEVIRNAYCYYRRCSHQHHHHHHHHHYHCHDVFYTSEAQKNIAKNDKSSSSSDELHVTHMFLRIRNFVQNTVHKYIHNSKFMWNRHWDPFKHTEVYISGNANVFPTNNASRSP